MWLPGIRAALADGSVDVIATGGDLLSTAGTERQLLGYEPLMIGLRPGDPACDEPCVLLESLATRTLGISPLNLFPAWGGVQREVLRSVGITPPNVELRDTDLAAANWLEQPELEWIFLTPSLARRHASTVVLPLKESRLVPFWMQWRVHDHEEPLLRSFVTTVTEIGLPEGWSTPAADGTTSGGWTASSSWWD